MNNFPRRGEIWLVNWNPARGSEQTGKRPALIIQNDIGNEKAPTTIVAAISSSVKLYPMNVCVNLLGVVFLGEKISSGFG